MFQVRQTQAVSEDLLEYMAKFDYEKVFEKGLQLVLDSPPLIGAIISARFMGSGWVYLIFNYYKNNRRGEKGSSTFFPATTIGMLPMIPISYILYGISFGWTLFPDFIKLLSLAFPVVLMSGLLLLIAFVLTTTFMNSNK